MIKVHVGEAATHHLQNSEGPRLHLWRGSPGSRIPRRAARQVAWALHNAKGGIPWHRVLGAGGNIRLPGHSGLEQRMRLEAEGVAFRGRRVDMDRHGFDFK